MRLKNPYAERRRIHSLAFGICEASVQKLAKVRGCFEWSRQYIFSCEKTLFVCNRGDTYECLDGLQTSNKTEDPSVPAAGIG